MKSIKTLAIAMVAICTVPLNGDVILQNWQFNDPTNGTELDAVQNDGTLDTSWNNGGPRTQNGFLNIGDTANWKWNVPAGNAGGNTFRLADFSANAVTSGDFLFEYRVQNWNLDGSAGDTPANMGVRFNIGTSTDYAQVRFETWQPSGQALDIRGRVLGTGVNAGSATQFGYGGNTAANRQNFVTFQVSGNLDSGDWSARTRAGDSNPWSDLTTDGTGLFSIERLQLVIQNPGDTWEHGGVQGTATEFVQLDYVTLTQFSAVPEPSSFMLFGMATVGLVARRRRK